MNATQTLTINDYEAEEIVEALRREVEAARATAYALVETDLYQAGSNQLDRVGRLLALADRIEAEFGLIEE